MTHRISLVVATKDRPNDLRTMLESLRAQTIAPVEVIVVDAGRESAEPVVIEFRDVPTRYLRHWPPSAAAQRNAGIRACEPSATLIGFADDDTTFEPQAFENMTLFWNEAGPDILGAAFNQRNCPERGNSALKQSALAELLGLYSSRVGSVSLSGWQTVIGEVDETLFVEWLPSTAVVFRREAFRNNLFDDKFDSYSYLEDLDLSYSLSHAGRLAVVSDAGYSHFPSTGGRISSRQFGRYEVSNRLHFVRKHHLSRVRCYLGLAVRFAMTVFSGLRRRDTNLLSRAIGNMDALLQIGTASKPVRTAAESV